MMDMPDTRNLDSLIDAFANHDDNDVRAGCAVHLVRFADDHRAVDALVAAIGDPFAEVRRCAALALAQCAGKLDGAAQEEAKSSLMIALRDPHIEVRVQARATLDALGLETE